jgi:hypothetical protein
VPLTILRDVFNTTEGWAVIIGLMWSVSTQYLGMPGVLFENAIPGGLTPGMFIAFGAAVVLAKIRPSGGAMPFRPIVTGSGAKTL